MKKTDIVILISAKHCNPNGDPDSDNMPRTNPDTDKGLISKGCIARKIRNFIQTRYGTEAGYDIYVKENSVLGQNRLETLKANGVAIKKKEEENLDGQKVLLEKYFDIRTFGGLLTGKETVNCGQVRGPVQITMLESVDPVTVIEMGITRCAAETPKEAAASKDGKSKTMGSTKMVSFGLYKGILSINPILAEASGFDEKDKERLIEALKHLFAVDTSSARPAGSMTVERLIAFEHEDIYGNEQTGKLLRSVKVTPKVETPESLDDYEISVAEPKKGIIVKEL
jgi:CRISPR-associated protein Csd2